MAEPFTPSFRNIKVHTSEVEKQSKNKRKRISWPEDDNKLTSKEGNAIKTERTKFQTVNIYVNWREFVDEDTMTNTMENQSVTKNSEVKIENFSEHTYKSKTGELITHSKFVNTDTINQSKKENYHKASNPTSALTVIIVNTPYSLRDFTKYPKELLEDIVDYLKFKISIIEIDGSSMIDYQSGLAGQKKHLPVLNKCLKQIEEFLDLI